MNLSIGPGTSFTPRTSSLGPGVVSAAGAVGRGRSEKARLVDAAKDFEAIMVQQLLETMRKAKIAEDPLDKGNTAEILHSMQDQAVAEAMTRGRGIGLADSIVGDLERQLRGGGH